MDQRSLTFTHFLLVFNRILLPAAREVHAVNCGRRSLPSWRRAWPARFSKCWLKQFNWWRRSQTKHTQSFKRSSVLRYFASICNNFIQRKVEQITSLQELYSSFHLNLHASVEFLLEISSWSRMGNNGPSAIAAVGGKCTLFRWCRIGSEHGNDVIGKKKNKGGSNSGHDAPRNEQLMQICTLVKPQNMNYKVDVNNPGITTKVTQMLPCQSERRWSASF